MLGLKPDPQNKRLALDVNLPQNLGWLDWRNLKLYGKTFHLHADHKGHHVEEQEEAKPHTARQHKEEAKEALS
jgi:hypothetical protein